MAAAYDASAAVPARPIPFRRLKHDGWLNSFGFEDIANFRDVAGVDPSAPALKVAGGHMKRGMLFRSSQLQFATAQDIAYMRDELKIKTYVDLRSDSGPLETRDGKVFDHYPPAPKSKKPQVVPQPGEHRRVNYHLLRGIGLRKLTVAERDGNEVAEPDSWLQFEFRDPVTKRVPKTPRNQSLEETARKLERHLSLNNKGMLLLNGSVIARVLHECVREENYPLVFGCVTGKDRTGLISCLILGALGASEEVIIEDFMLSQAAMKHNSLLAARNFELARAEFPEAFADSEGPGSPSDPKNQIMASVFPGIMSYTLQVISERGGFKAYLGSIGFGAEDQRRLREMLVVEDAPSSKL